MGKRDERDEQMAIEGEIVAGPWEWNKPYGGGEAPDPERPGRGYGTGPGRRFIDLDEDDIRGIVAERLQGATLRALAAKHKVSPQTIRNWTEGHVAGLQPTDIVKARNHHAAHFEAVRDAAWELYRAGKLARDPRVMLDAMTQVRFATESITKLRGLNAPVKVDVEVVALTEAEKELREMLNEAAAKQAAEEAAVIKAAESDPDL